MAAKITAVYVRVSSQSQDVASQLPALETYARAVEGPVKYYRDKFTGKTMERPGFQNLMRDVEAGLIERIVVWRLDRLGRTASGLTKLFDDLKQRKVGLVSLKDGLDLSTAAGRLMADVLASVASYETEVRAERTLAGLAVARAKGVRLGRKPVGTGNGKPLKVTPEQAVQVKRLKAEGGKVAAISRAVGLSRPTVYGILKG